MTESKKNQATEETVLVTRGIIEKAIAGLQKSLQEKNNSKKNLLDTDLKYIVQVCLFKIPQGTGKLNRILLPHTLLDDTDEVCLLVKDLERGAKKDFNPTKDHFEEVLKLAGVTRINRVIPVNELKTDYGPFEAKLKLCQSFDVFLADSRIYNRVLPLLGKHFLKRKKLPLAVKMDCDDLNEDISKALRYTVYKQTNTGNTVSIDVGKHRMPEEEIADNIEALLNQLKSQLPGGLDNIRSLYLKPASDDPTSIPIYVNTSSGQDVEVPKVISQKEKILTKKRKIVNDVLEDVGFSAKGKIISKKFKKVKE
ncbi:hypothetical protein DMENIID0001_099630 [Sergentomyia squamirostris]